MEVFNINNFTGLQCVMHCVTEEEANIFCEYLDRLGERWCDGSRYTHHTNYKSYKDQTCYNFINGTYGDLKYFLEGNYIVLEFCDFHWDNYNAEIELDDEDVNTINGFLEEFQLI